MSSGLSRNKRFNAARLKRRLSVLPSAPSGGGDASIVSATPTGSVMTIVFDRPVVLGDGPTGISTNLAVEEVSAAQTSSTTVEVTYGGSVAAATSITLPNPLNNIRTPTGGFVHSLSFQV